MSENENTCRACGSPAKEGSPLCSTCWGKLPTMLQRGVYHERARGEEGRAHEAAVKRALELRR